MRSALSGHTDMDVIDLNKDPASDPPSGGVGASNEGNRLKTIMRDFIAKRGPDAEIQGAHAAAFPEAWARLPMVATAPKYGRRARVRLISSRPSDPASKAFDQLRTRLLRALRSNSWSRIAIAAPRSSSGSTFVTANLGLSLSRLASVRAVLTDLNLRQPGLARAFDIRRSGALEPMLLGEKPIESHAFRVGENLAFVLNDTPVTAPAARLQDPTTWTVLDRMQRQLLPDVTLCDLPPILGGDEVEAVLPHVDGVLLVTDGTRTTAREIAECERLLDGHTPLLGVVLNRAEQR